MGRTGYEFTPEQEKAIGELVCDRWGWNFQTQVSDIDGCHVLWAQQHPNARPQRYEVQPDGTVIFGDG